ncbi:MAG: hypothetical protein L6Q75_09045 [Burkholderiaceae bacterium]|nr:hypothetical protein [Burkholderiaceae bacterium]
MSESKDPPKSGFFRKVVRFALNPTTDWADLNNPNSEQHEDDAARSEIKAMIERKRRNDFVRKREFDMLRKIRREGLTGDGLAGLEGLSHLDDSEVRINEPGARPDSGVKDKIDAIERQMVGETVSTPTRRGAAVMRSVSPSLSDSFFAATTAPQVMATTPVLTDAFKPTTPMQLEGLPVQAPSPAAQRLDTAPAAMLGQGVSALSPLYGDGNDASNAFAFEVNEIAHDAELDEAVIAFANADFDQCERVLQALVAAGGLRAQHSDTWLALFDLYRATGQQSKFETLAMDYLQRFGWSAPQWYSLPRMVAEQAAQERPRSAARGNVPLDATVGWVCPEALDADGVAQLRSQLLQMPLPWVLDWRTVLRIDAQAATALTRLLHEWADQPVQMRWIGGERFFQLLAEAAPAGVRDADPAFWMLKLEALRLANRAPDFDQAAIDYCMTYEVSPPSWAPAQCSLQMASSSGVTIAQPALSADVSTGFMESEPADEGPSAVASVELNGQLVGDIAPLLKQLDAQIGAASLINVNCSRLIRVDFIAAGDLLNWVLARRSENRTVSFVDAHRLVALFCGAMGINEHARVTVRNL